MKLLASHDSVSISNNISVTENNQSKPYFEIFINPNSSKATQVSTQSGSDDLLMAVDSLCEVIDSSDDDVFLHDPIRSLSSHCSFKLSDDDVSEPENSAKLSSRSFLRTRKVASRRSSVTRKGTADNEEVLLASHRSMSATDLQLTPVVKREPRRNLNLNIPGVKAKVDKLVNMTQEKIKCLQDSQVAENGLRTKVLLESALKKLTSNEVSVHSPPLTSKFSLTMNIPPSSPRKRSINESLCVSRPSSPPSPSSSPVPGHIKNYQLASAMIPSSPEPDQGDDLTSLTLSDSIKRMKLINSQQLQHLIEDHPNRSPRSEASNSMCLE